MPLLKPSRTTDDKAIFRNVDRTLIFAKKNITILGVFKQIFQNFKK